MQNGPDRSLTVAFRGLGKSILASFYALWRLRMDPNEKIMIVSATAVKATDFSSFMLRCMGEIDVLNCLLPGPENRFSNVAFDVGPCMVEQSPSVRSMGVMGQTTGQRCTCAILDDIETLANVITQLKQERVAHAVTEMESILKPDEGQLLPRKILYLRLLIPKRRSISAWCESVAIRVDTGLLCIQRRWIAMTAILIPISKARFFRIQRL